VVVRIGRTEVYIIVFFLSTRVIMSDNAKTTWFGKSFNSGLEAGDICRRFAGDGGIRNLRRGT
jgi:hypothetical protein